MKLKLLTLVFGALFLSIASRASDLTASLYVCKQADGVSNIVSAAQGKGKKNCRPYQKGMLGGINPNATIAVQPQASIEKKVETPPLRLTSLPVEQVEKPRKNNKENKAKAAPKLIFMCPEGKDKHSIVEAYHPPRKDCVSFGKKGGKDVLVAEKQLPIKMSQDKSQSTQTEKKIAIDTSLAQDIYKCFDNEGKPSYVGANQRSKFRQCSFFSRSFAGVKEELIKKANTPSTLAELAASGVSQKEQLLSKAAIVCTGAGEITYNGKTQEYQCANRSYDHSKGSTGGEISLGNKYATISAHRLDYLNTAGSCGGVITTDNGRILHLEPTKECPESFHIEARRIAREFKKTISINVSGAFKQRQRQLAGQINQIAAQIGVDPYLVHAVISAESAYKSRAVSHAGAQGLMQLMPATARRFGVSDSFHTGENIRGGTTYLKWLLNEFNGNMELAVAGYNAGEGNVRKYGYVIPPFIETRAYVPKVMEYYRRYRNNPNEIGL